MVDETAPQREAADAAEGTAAPDVRAAEPVRRRILVVDDSGVIRKSLRDALLPMPNVGEILEAADGLDGLSLLARSMVDLIITDVTMPRLDGFKFLSAVRNNPRLRDVMVIMLSSHGEVVDKVRGLTIGANDYVTKPFERGELQARVTVMLKMKELQEELQRKNRELEKANQMLEFLAQRDGLTGLPNRRFFFERFEVEFSRAARRHTPLSCVMVDIDHFKRFNDRHGHQAGDEALRAVAEAIQRAIRGYDLAGRYGGEEFITFLPETDRESALAVGERLRRHIAALRLPVRGADGEEVSLTASLGIATYPDLPATRVEDLVAGADKALYEAKAAGRDRCVVFTP